MRLIARIFPLLVVMLGAGAACAAAPPGSGIAKPTSASTTATRPRFSPADEQRVHAIQQYQHDLVSVVALRADPDYLLGAALLAKPFKNQTLGLDFDALSARAAAAPDAGPAVEWARLGLCKRKADCPNAEAFAYLKKHAADNAAVWLIALDMAAARNDAKAERAALKKAATATLYDDYYGKALAGVAKVVAVLPPQSVTTQGTHDGQPDNPEGVRLFVTLTTMQNHIRPGFGPLEQLCGKDDAGKHSDLDAECLKLAHTLQWGSSPAARAMGLRIQGELRPGDDAGNAQANRNLAWQAQQYSELLQHALTDSAQASQWLAAARRGGTELSLILSTLRANRIPLDAPASAASTGQ